jgi:hypothetical protein
MRDVAWFVGFRRTLLLVTFFILMIPDPDGNPGALASTNSDAVYETETKLFWGQAETDDSLEWGDLGIPRIDDGITYSGVGFIYWSDGRYLNPENPFFFVPFNARNPYWNLSATRVPQDGGADLFLGGLVAREYSRSLYLGGSAHYLSHFEPGAPDPLGQSFSAEFGFHDPWIEAGIRFQALRYDGKALSEGLLRTWTVRITPVPSLLIKLDLSRVFQGTGNGNWERNAGEVVYVTPRFWWQFGAGFTRTSSGEGDSTMETTIHVGKHLRNLLVKYTYQTEDADNSLVSPLRTGTTGSLQVRLDPTTIVEAAYTLTEYDREQSGPESTEELRHLYLGISRLF